MGDRRMPTSKPKGANPNASERGQTTAWLATRGFTPAMLKNGGGLDIIRAGRSRQQITDDLKVKLKDLPNA